jgi:hypothetical protein
LCLNQICIKSTSSIYRVNGCVNVSRLDLVIRPAQSKALHFYRPSTDQLLKWRNHFTHLELFFGECSAEGVRFPQNFICFSPRLQDPSQSDTGSRFIRVTFAPISFVFPLKVQTFKGSVGRGSGLNGDDWCQGFFLKNVDSQWEVSMSTN